MTNKTIATHDPKLEENKEYQRKLIFAACIFVALGFGVAYWGFKTASNEAASIEKASNNAASNSSKNRYHYDFLSAVGSFWQGSVASIWSLASVCLIGAAYLAQREQLIKQDHELREQQKQFDLQKKSDDRRNFEDTFFQLINLHHRLVDGFRTTTMLPEMTGKTNIYERTVLEGRLCLVNWEKGLRESFNLNVLSERSLGTKEASENELLVRTHYLGFFDGVKAELGHYFTNLYHLIRFIQRSDVEDKQNYANIVRAQLSQYELTLLFYNCLTPYGNDFKPLVEEFEMLKTFDEARLFRTEHYHLFSPKAYGRKEQADKKGLTA